MNESVDNAILNELLSSLTKRHDRAVDAWNREIERNKDWQKYNAGRTEIIISMNHKIRDLTDALIDEWRRAQWGEEAIDEKLMALGLQPVPASTKQTPDGS